MLYRRGIFRPDEKFDRSKKKTNKPVCNHLDNSGRLLNRSVFDRSQVINLFPFAGFVIIMAAQQFFLRWDNFSTHITTAFGTLRNQEDFVDVTLSCEGKKIRAHKVLLSACSTYFREVFKDNPCPHPVIVFKNVKYEDLLAIVEFMYQGEVNVVQDSLPSFLHTAELLSVQGLTEGGNNNSSSSHTILESAQPSSTHIITPKTVTLKSPQMNIQPERRFVRKVMPAQATTLKTVTHPITLVSSKMISPITKKVTSGVPASSKPNSTTLVTAQDPLSGSSPVVKRKRFVIDSDENISFEGVNYMKQEDYSMKIDLPEFIEIRTTDDGKGTTTTDMSNVVTDEMMSGTESDNPSQENVIIEEGIFVHVSLLTVVFMAFLF